MEAPRALIAGVYAREASSSHQRCFVTEASFFPHFYLTFWPGTPAWEDFFRLTG